jgi:hypothetical protein
VLRPVSHEKGGRTDRGDQDQEEADSRASHSVRSGEMFRPWERMQGPVQRSSCRSIEGLRGTRTIMLRLCVKNFGGHAPRYRILHRRFSTQRTVMVG